MLTRYYILEGDTTTAGGVVQKTSNTMSFKVYGKQQSYLGDDVYCPACKSMGRIIPDQDRLSTKVGGRIPALNDDLCLCLCNPPPKLINSQTTFKEIVKTDPLKSHDSHREQTHSKTFDKCIQFDFGEHSNEIFPYLRYRLQIDGRYYEGSLDNNGSTGIFYSGIETEITDLELFFSEHSET